MMNEIEFFFSIQFFFHLREKKTFGRFFSKIFGGIFKNFEETAKNLFNSVIRSSLAAAAVDGASIFFKLESYISFIIKLRLLFSPSK